MKLLFFQFFPSPFDFIIIQNCIISRRYLAEMSEISKELFAMAVFIISAEELIKTTPML